MHLPHRIFPAPPMLQIIGEPLALVRFRRNITGATIDTARLAATFGVTPAEARVLAALVNGMAPAAYAAENAVAESTVRSQIGSLKNKMLCSRIVDLVRIAIRAST